jgi:hypothetical protein
LKFNKKQSLEACIKTANQDTPSSTAEQTPQHTTHNSQRSKKHTATQLKKNQNRVTATANRLKAMNIRKSWVPTRPLAQSPETASNRRKSASGSTGCLSMEEPGGVHANL